MFVNRASTGKKKFVKFHVILLDDTTIDFELKKHRKGIELLRNVCDYVNIAEYEADYFGMTVLGIDEMNDFWMNIEKSMNKQLNEKRNLLKMLNNEKYIVELRIKYYPIEPGYLKEDFTRYLLTLQLRRDILKKKLNCSTVTKALLASYIIQSELGDYSEICHEPNGDELHYLRSFQFQSMEDDKDDDFLKKVLELHQMHEGQMPAQADLNYLDNVKKLPLYGTTLFDAYDAENLPIYIGISAYGISVLRKNDYLKLSRFPWPKIMKMSYKKLLFFLHLRPSEFCESVKILGFRSVRHSTAKQLWLLGCEYHHFFRMKENDMPLTVANTAFSSIRSHLSISKRFRHSSRFTLAQMNSLPSSRIEPDFIRTYSKQQLSSSMHRINMSDEDNCQQRLYRTKSLSRHLLSKMEDENMNNFISNNSYENENEMERMTNEHSDMNHQSQTIYNQIHNNSNFPQVNRQSQNFNQQQQQMTQNFIQQQQQEQIQIQNFNKQIQSQNLIQQQSQNSLHQQSSNNNDNSHYHQMEILNHVPQHHQSQQKDLLTQIQKQPLFQKQKSEEINISKGESKIYEDKEETTSVQMTIKDNEHEIVEESGDIIPNDIVVDMVQNERDEMKVSLQTKIIEDNIIEMKLKNEMDELIEINMNCPQNSQMKQQNNQMNQSNDTFQSFQSSVNNDVESEGIDEEDSFHHQIQQNLLSPVIHNDETMTVVTETNDTIDEQLNSNKELDELSHHSKRSSSIHNGQNNDSSCDEDTNFEENSPILEKAPTPPPRHVFFNYEKNDDQSPMIDLNNSTITTTSPSIVDTSDHIRTITTATIFDNYLMEDSMKEEEHIKTDESQEDNKLEGLNSKFSLRFSKEPSYSPELENAALIADIMMIEAIRKVSKLNDELIVEAIDVNNENEENKEEVVEEEIIKSHDQFNCEIEEKNKFHEFQETTKENFIQSNFLYSSSSLATTTTTNCMEKTTNLLKSFQVVDEDDV
ncbi:hypothetical protein SNEBB_003902 [Seison nebaliae]|nr:hypothetical protein SNEBB_003902 [Seison nebaliae]